MKRSLYDSEYERVRREAGLKNGGRLRAEFPEEDEPAAPRRFSSLELDQDFKDRMCALSAREIEEQAKRKAEGDRYSLEVNARMARREYEVLGLTPPEPFVSLALLKTLGWRVEHFEVAGQGRWELIRPAGAPAPRRQEEV